MEPLCKRISELEDKEHAMTAQVKKVKDDQKSQKEKIKAFTELVNNSVTAYNTKLTSLMENWTENKVRPALNAIRDFKAKVEKMPMADFVRKNTQVLLQAQHLNASNLRDFSYNQDPKYPYVEFKFENYHERRIGAQKTHWSDPIVVDVVSYRLKVHANGWKKGEGSHISVGIQRNKLISLNLDTCDKVYNVTRMVHSEDSQKDFEDRSTTDWTDKGDICFITAEFYRIDDLSKDGFIHEDGSLRFILFIKRNNFQSRLM